MKTALRRTSIYPLGLAFFGLTPADRLRIFTTIHEIVFHGKGGYSWSEVYNMPIWLRKFTFQKLKEFYDKENKENEKIYNQRKKRTVSKPKNKPTYRTKASNK